MNKKLFFKRLGFYILSFTWGFIMSFIGLFPIVVLACMKRIKVFHGRLYGIVGKGWGGVELGCFFLCGEDCQTEHIMAHECGHGIQNIIWGPLMPFVVCIPSAIRYWYFYFYSLKYQTWPNDYDSIWFEGQATRWGKKYILTDCI